MQTAKQRSGGAADAAIEPPQRRQGAPDAAVQTVAGAGQVHRMVAAVEAGKYADDLALLHPLRGQAVVTADEVALRQDAYHPMQDIFLPHAIQRDIVAAQAALGRAENDGVAARAQHGVHAGAPRGGGVDALGRQHVLNTAGGHGSRKPLSAIWRSMAATSAAACSGVTS